MTEVLSDQQKRFYGLFGYLVIPGLMTDVIEDITTEFDAEFARHADANGKLPSHLPSGVDNNERLRSLVDDPRIDGIAAGLLGEDYNYLYSHCARFGGDTDWHPNQEAQPYPFLQIAMYLDPVGADTGALRVIPGSHKSGTYRDEVQSIIGGPRQDALTTVDADDVDGIAESLAATLAGLASARMSPNPSQSPDHYTKTLGLTGAEVPAAVLASQPGDVVVFDEGTVHGAFGGIGRIRRQLRFGVAGHCSDEQLPALRKHITWMMAHQHWQSHSFVDRLNGEALMASASEQRMRHLVQAMSVEDQLPEVAQRLRERLLHQS